MLAAIGISISTIADAQLVVRIRPIAPEIRVRTENHSPGNVWVEGEYVNNGGRYDYNEGHWAAPPRNSHRWKQGRWRSSRRGYSWEPGRWR